MDIIYIISYSISLKNIKKQTKILLIVQNRHSEGFFDDLIR